MMRMRWTSSGEGGADHVIRREAKQRRRVGGAALPYNRKELEEKRSLRTWHVMICVFCGLIGILVLSQITIRSINEGGGEDHPRITIFSAPRPFSIFPPYNGSSTFLMEERQNLAVRSWLALSPAVTVVLFSNHPSVKLFANAVGPRVSVEDRIDFTFLGTPFFHSMISWSQASNSDISVLVDPETVLLPDFITALQHTYELDMDWFLVSLSTKTSYLPFHLDATNKVFLIDGEEHTKFGKLKAFTKQNQHSDTCGERVILAWNTRSTPLHAGVLPPFLYGRGFHDQWIISEILLAGYRSVIDASEAISSFYLETKHDSSSLVHKGDTRDRDWENNCNYHLASVYGSLFFKKEATGNLLRLVKCMEHYVLVDASGKIVHTFQYIDEEPPGNHLPIEIGANAGFMKRLIRQTKLKKLRACVGIQTGCSVMNLPEAVFGSSAQLALPFSLEQLLKMVADDNNSIVLAVAGNSYRDMLMSWVCRLRLLSVKNFVIGALDAETYKFSIIQGLPVFMDPLAPSNISFDNCHFGSDCFPTVTKVKSRLVLHIMKLGYNVLLSDVDVYWFQNPLPYLSSFGPAVLVAQSDEYNETGPINMPRRLNSGFYFAHSDNASILALEKVVRHASVSKLSEQPSFYDVLCGVGGVNRVGNNRCIEPETNLTIHFLDRDIYPNGAYQGLWEKDNVASECRKKGSMVLHNNWISGRQRKLERQISSGLWAYNSSFRMCSQKLDATSP